MERIQVALQDDTGGHFIDDLFSLLPAHPGLNENILRRFAGQRLVPFDYGKGKSGLEQPGEAVDFLALDAFRSIKSQGIADDDFFDAIASDQNFQGSQNLILIFPHDRGQALAGKTQLITEGNPDSFASVVETEYPNLPFPPPLLRPLPPRKGKGTFMMASKFKSMNNSTSALLRQKHTIYF
jgi:hypothetical protein